LNKRGNLSYLTQLYWSSGYDPRIVFFNYPELTFFQEYLLNIMFIKIVEYKNKELEGVFPTLN